MKEILGHEVTDEYFDYLFREQAKGKTIKEVNNEVVAVEHKSTEEELVQKELIEIEDWFAWYDNQVAQYGRCQRLGIEFDKDINELDNQAKKNQERIAEIRSAL